MLVNRLCFLSIHFCFSKYRFIRTFVPDGRVTRVVVRQAHSGRRRIHDSVRSRIITPCLAFFDGRKYFFGFDERDTEKKINSSIITTTDKHPIYSLLVHSSTSIRERRIQLLVIRTVINQQRQLLKCIICFIPSLKISLQLKKKLY